MNATICEFPLRKASDIGSLARRARLLATLVELPIRRRREIEEAVATVCQVLIKHGEAATIRYALTQRSGQRYVEVSVRSQRAGGWTGSQSTGTPSADEVGPVTEGGGDSSLQRLGEMLDRFDVSRRPPEGAVIRMGQALSPSFAVPGPRELEQWREILATRSLEDALVLALQYSRSATVQLGRARDREALHEALHEEFGGATPSENLAMLSLVASRSRNLISFMEADGTISWVNEAFVEATAYSPFEAIGKRMDELLFGPSTNEAAVRAYQQAIRNGHDLKHDVMLYRRDGRTFWAEFNLIPIHGDNGELTRWMSVDVDITRRRQTEEALLAAKEQAEASARVKSEFLANMSHEIRTPMNAIIGMTELALAHPSSAEQRDHLRTVQTSAESLLQLLNDILDLSKIEAGKLEIDEVDFNMAETIRDTLKALAVKAHQKGLELAAHVPMDLPQFFCGDPARLKQILFNLVGNAIKFTEGGEVVVEVESQWKTDDEIGLHFSVRDTGIGIPKEKLNKIFEAFTQADSATTRQFGGTGLGLTITSELVRLMHGKIWAESNVGKGSTFHFTLQARLSKHPPATASGDARLLAGKRALIVDDSATNRRILKEMLRHWNVAPTLADGAQAALEILEQATEQEQPFDLVLLDAMMPVADGFQLAEQIKERADLQCGAVLMLSSADRTTSAPACRELGIASYLVKPISASNLLNAILSTIEDSQIQAESPRAAEVENESESGAGPAPDRPASSPLKVLVADDHQANRELATTVLSKRGHHCIEALDGRQALAVLEREACDVVLMDVQMPNMDGFEATQKIREQEASGGGRLPVIALTAHAMKGDREKCLAAGMDAYLAKPLRPRELIELVESLVAAPEKSAPGKAASRDDGQASRAQQKPFDFDAALESMDNDVELLVQQMQFFLHDGPNLLEQIREAIEDGDARKLELGGHRLKGLLARYRAERATQLAQELEQRGVNNDFAGVTETCRQLAVSVQQLHRAIERYVEDNAGDSRS